ncbi:uncharacterized protein BO66DRAFT_475666 [Aspergillus aculeatinus CBS 121060]|uniref:Uncharacterized protein n=1 Tax=Aspergillus aculeatinus CBS 121060 TaxID=1448322 RepID=A0ACD1GTC1_9EURO|nr:hypothetical protein BO66DRAFT_475666 [Aspergillus aculeatinus CBS 121060]RAH64563.1 hypothetical protein BO66DRAFT_475666 [Aspergillus aculeatinus CBS 121060]
MANIGLSDSQQWRPGAPFNLVGGLDDWLKRLSQMAKGVLTGLLAKAPKRSFAIRLPAEALSPQLGEVAKVPATPSPQGSATGSSQASVKTNGTKKDPVKEYLNTVPGVPFFYVGDDSKVTVTQKRTALSFGVNYANTTSETKTSSQDQTVGNAALSWEARGGDTVLCSNPSAWAATVKDYFYWRITEQSQTVFLVSVIDGIDPNMAHKVEYPDQEHGSTPDNTKLTERELINKATNLLQGPEISKPMQVILNAYKGDSDKRQYNDWVTKEKPHKVDLRRLKNVTSAWSDISPSQQIYYIIFFHKEKKLNVFS